MDAARRFPPFASLQWNRETEHMICWPVSPRVGDVKNNDPSLIEPLAAS